MGSAGTGCVKPQMDQGANATHHVPVDLRVEVPPDLLVRVEREGGRGSPPVATTEIHASGQVSYLGRRNVALLGRHEWTVDGEVVRALWSAIVAQGAMDIRESLDETVKDARKTVLVIRANGAVNRIVNRWSGRLDAGRAQLHSEVDALAEEVERLARASVLIRPAQDGATPK
jgi:hypothetical protein